MREAAARWAAQLWVLVGALGCGGQAAPPPDPAPVGVPAAQTRNCPGTFAEMNAAVCSSPGLECTVDFACRATPQQVRCTCERLRFRCYDSVGLLEPGASPRCLNGSPPPTEPCPTTVDTGQGVTCPDIGKACFYDGQVCADGVTKLDYCQCKPASGGTLAYQCARVPCGPTIETHP
jgi:hypothetical protein